MPDPALTALRAAVESYVEPNLGESLGRTKALIGIEQREKSTIVRLRLGFPIGGYEEELTAALNSQIRAAGIETSVEVELSAEIESHAVQRNLQPLARIKNIVAVASGKGGVGKSTVAANLALAWAGQGARVGLLDADIYGPSVPLMMGVAEARPTMTEGKKILPVERYGLSLISMGFFLDDTSPVIWRASVPMGKARAE